MDHAARIVKRTTSDLPCFISACVQLQTQTPRAARFGSFSTLRALLAAGESQLGRWLEFARAAS
ncbi:hypothetical protein EJB05_35146, partial [Eragrostis curvula]